MGWEESPDYGSPRRGPFSYAVAIAVIAGASALLATCVLEDGADAQVLALEQVSGVASVIDGDTIEIHGRSVRLSGFDSPERGSFCGQVNVYQRAALALSDFVGTRTVTCDITGRDRYGRATGRCRLGSVDLGDYLVGLGWARDWPQYSNGQYADEEAQARSNQLGIWGLQCPANLWGARDYSPRTPRQAGTTTAPSPIHRAIAYVTASSLNVRSGPGPEHPVVGRLEYRARVQVQGGGGAWVQIEADDGLSRGWVSASYLSYTEPAPQPEPAVSDARIRAMIIQRSLASYGGSCPCPDNVDRGGRRCGGRSAYSRPGGASPICYASDISDAEVEAFRRSGLR